jgi:hypothetical protein
MNTDLANSLLSGPDYFRCELMRCTMRKASCVARRKTGHGFVSKGTEIIPSECRDCSQGAEIAGESKQASAIKEREMENKTKECRRCGEGKSLDEYHLQRGGRMGRSSICKRCKSIIDKIGWVASKEQDASAKPSCVPQKTFREASELLREHKLVKYPCESEPASLSVEKPDRTTITLDFEGREDVLAWLSRTAAENFRNPEQQALYVLHQVAGSRA